MKSVKKINKNLTSYVLKVPFSAFLYKQYKGMRNRVYFLKDYWQFSAHNDKRLSVNISDFSPQLFDNTESTYVEPHYTYHPAWAARILAQTRPKLHIDFSSYLPFNTIVSAFVPIDFYDYRPAQIKLDNLHTKKGDLLAMPFKDNSVASLSCMHTVEHIGLGRYGDPIDPHGDLKAIKELKRVLAPGGDLLFVVPLGRPRIIFNANRVYSYENIIEYFADLELKEFSLIPDNVHEVGIIKNPSKEVILKQKDACGCFWFSKR